MSILKIRSIEIDITLQKSARAKNLTVEWRRTACFSASTVDSIPTVGLHLQKYIKVHAFLPNIIRVHSLVPPSHFQGNRVAGLRACNPLPPPL